jgi:hypothetical protein
MIEMNSRSITLNFLYTSFMVKKKHPWPMTIWYLYMYYYAICYISQSWRVLLLHMVKMYILQLWAICGFAWGKSVDWLSGTIDLKKTKITVIINLACNLYRIIDIYITDYTNIPVNFEGCRGRDRMVVVDHSVKTINII